MTSANPAQTAWVVFTGQTDLPWLKILKPGFRHCFVVMTGGGRWFSVDPLANYTDVQIHDGLAAEFDLPGWLRAQGHKVVEAKLSRHNMRPAPVMIFTCVEAVKRILGLRSVRIFTPWQLYCRLCRDEKQGAGNYTLTTEKGDLSWEV